MTEPARSDPPQRSNRSRQPVDTRFAAALELGYYSRDIDLEILNHSLAVLGNEVHQNVFLALRQVIERLGTSDDEKELQRALLPNLNWLDKREEETWDVKELRLYADQTIPRTNQGRVFYDVGAALGDYWMECKGNREKPGADRFWVCVRDLPAQVTKQIDVLNRLIKLKDKAAPLDVLLNEAWYHGTGVELASSPPESLYRRFVHAISAAEVLSLLPVEVVSQIAPETAKRTFVPTLLQTNILAALNGRALKKDPLAKETCKGEGSRLYRKGGLKELIDEGLVIHRHGIGYYRPDAPPPNAIPLDSREGAN
jgi:hypothetical protein